MNKAIHHFTFRPAVKSQRALVHQWLQQDYISEWIHGQGLQNTLNGLEKFFQYEEKGKALNRNTDITQHWVGFDEETPFVYLLTTNVFENNDLTKYREVAGLAITLDIFIGDKEYLGKGLASRIIREFLLHHFSDVSEVFIDPEKSNHRAVHVYQRTGFRIVSEYIAPWYPVPHYIMKLQMKELQDAHR